MFYVHAIVCPCLSRSHRNSKALVATHQLRTNTTLPLFNTTVEQWLAASRPILTALTQSPSAWQ